VLFRSTQLLDLSRLESGALPMQHRPFDVLPVLDDAAEEARLAAPAVSVEVEADVSGPLIALGDPERIHQVLANLLENAVRHSPLAGRVLLRARHTRERVELQVCDEGPGIPEEEATRVFERFYRADSARSSSAGGAGLGLAIARWIVEMHGGEIRAERRLPTGCRMVVTLPRGTSPRAGAEGRTMPAVGR
jgi:signal transduction histidine kinase